LLLAAATPPQHSQLIAATGAIICPLLSLCLPSVEGGRDDESQARAKTDDDQRE
jgi:hypothetical protein